MSLSANYTVTETKDLNAQLGWTARSVQIDNITSSWIWVPAGGRFVPPFQYGVIVPLEGTQQGNIQWRTPVGIPVPTAGSATAQVTFMQEALPASNGQPVNVPTQPTLCTVASVTGTFSSSLVGGTSIPIVAASNGSVTLNVPPATETLTFGTDADFRIQIQGVQSSIFYTPNSAPVSILPLLNAGGIFSLEFSSAIDNQITVTIDTVGTLLNNPAHLRVSATPAPQAVTVVNTPYFPLSVTPVAKFNPTGATSNFVSATNATATVTLTAGLTTNTIVIYDISASYDGTTAAGDKLITVTDTTAVSTVWLQDIGGAVAQGSFHYNLWPGIVLPVGHSATVTLTASGAAGVDGRLSVLSGLFVNGTF